MKLSTLLSIASIYMVLAGLGFILFPQAFGRGAVPSDASPALIAYLRLIGSPMLGIAVLNWMARKEGPSTARNAIIIGNTVGFAVIAALDIWGLFNDARPATKVFVVIHLLFTLAFLILGRKNMLKG
ncbi:hypothetical protein LL912_01100 [Niabella sp. CC-SYL272]|uniref:hypothetical protein n=1 Tax=Niabella agricola TaxID=2891571 RepID=UPI001F454B16|nr:hypothetical protein [Niabella agricola]MCF3107365.1 hypothetical protein [Niabella agricola]